MATQGKTLQVAVYGLELRVKSEIGKHAMSSSAARKARIGEVPQAEGFVRINVATLPNLQKSRCAAVGQPLRLAGSPLPLYRADAAIQGKTLLRFRLLVINVVTLPIE